MSFIEAIGWLALALVGGYFVAGLAFFISANFFFKGGLEALPPSMAASVVSGVAWVCFIAWLSPLTIGAGK